jgi:hypothetical protein
MIGALGLRMAVLPDIGAADLPERALSIGSAGLDDDRELVDSG